jgi:hypothetical protein
LGAAFGEASNWKEMACLIRVISFFAILNTTIVIDSKKQFCAHVE